MVVRRVLILVAAYFLLWGLTATIGVHFVSRAAVRDPFCTMLGRKAGCDADGYAPGPFIVHVHYHLAGAIGLDVNQTTLWLLGIRVPLRKHQFSL
jgi:hypothetical protein